MKQHISPQQLKMMGRDNIDSLFNFTNREKDFYTYHCKKVTIGKMIEVLEKESVVRLILLLNSYKEDLASRKDRICLCDALWEGLCQVVEKKEL